MAVVESKWSRGLRLQRWVANFVRPLVVRIAFLVPIFGVLEHTGRKSGRVYRTPLAAVHDGEEFVLPLAFGTQAGWVRNLSSAGRARLEVRGRSWDVSDPRVVDWADGSRALGWYLRTFAPLFHIQGFIRVRASASPG